MAVPFQLGDRFPAAPKGIHEGMGHGGIRLQALRTIRRLLALHGGPLVACRPCRVKINGITQPQRGGYHNESLSERQASRLSNEAAARGADAALVLTPSYYKGRMTHKAFVAQEVRQEVDTQILRPSALSRLHRHASTQSASVENASGHA